jgi:slime mold repeat-containing protein
MGHRATVMRRRARGLARSIPAVLAAHAAAALLATGAAEASSTNCPSTLKLWTALTITTPAPASAPVTDTAFSSVAGRSRSYVAYGTELETFNNTDFPQGCMPGTGLACAPTGGTCTRLKGCKVLPSWTTLPVATLLSAPTVVPLSQNPAKEYLFVGAQDSGLYRLDVSGEPPYPMVWVATNRPSCPGDSILAAPAVQLYAYSNTEFQNEVDSHPGHSHDDVVMVITKTGCGDLSHNRVIAYWASDLSVKWVFNGPTLPGDETGAVRMGTPGEGCAVDPQNNRLYCGTDTPPRSSQDSLWAISSLNGALVWSHNAGAILNRPTLNPSGSRLYVVTREGLLWAYDPAGNGAGGPALLWPGPVPVVSPGATVAHSPRVVPGVGGAADRILTLDSAGKLFAVQDNLGFAEQMYTAVSPEPSTGRWVSTPLVLPDAAGSQVFIGRSDGTLQMVTVDGGLPEGILSIGAAGTTVYDPAFDSDPASGVLNRLVVVGGTTMARVTVPLCTTPPNPGAIGCNCTDGKVCGTGNAGDPFRCCNLAKDSCIQSALYNPCKPLRCSVMPSCCIYEGAFCITDADCGGRPGSCDVISEFCSAPCDPLIQCVGASNTCQYYGGSAFLAPDGTVCDDKQACTWNTTPAATPVACVLTQDSSSCTRDRPASAALTSDCPASAPICSSGGTSEPGQGGPVISGKCCPQGTACDLATSTCRGNSGAGLASGSGQYDVCLSGWCASDTYSSCVCDVVGERACASGQVCCGTGCYDLNNDPQHCGSCTNDCRRFGNPGLCVAGECVSGAACIGPDRDDLVFAASSQAGLSALEFEYTADATCRAYATDYRTDAVNSLAQIDDLGLATTYAPSPPQSTRLNGVAVSQDGGQLFAAMVNDAGGSVPGLALRAPGSSTYSRVKTALPTGGADDSPFDQVQFNTGPVGPAFDTATFTNDTSRRLWFGDFQCPATPLDGPCTCVDNGLCSVDFSNGVTWAATPVNYCNQPCLGTGSCYFAGTCPGPPERITALAFDDRIVVPATSAHRLLIVAHGTTLSFLDIAGGAAQHDINLANPARFNPNPARGESTVEAILSIAPLPYGDAILEVRGAGDKPAPGNVRNTWLLYISFQDSSVSDALDVQRGLKHVAPCAASAPLCPDGYACSDNACMKTCGTCPGGFTCSANLCRISEEIPPNFGLGAGLDAGNGRLAVMPTGKLLRWVTAANQLASNMAQFDVLPLAAVPCSDGDACTVDGFDSATQQCVHAPISCEDGNACTLDSCTAGTGACVHAPLSCDDSDVCTADSCSSLTGCQHAPIVLSEPGPVQFASGSVLQWPATPDAGIYNTYRGTIPANMLGSRGAAVYDQVCYESADAMGDGPTISTDASPPPLGTGFYYLVSGEQGCESALGHASSGAPIPNISPCPTPP